MSQTRHASDGRLRQNRFCSAPENEGDTINGFLAAKRISLIEDHPIREILWFIQWRSLEPSGLHQLSRELIARFPERLTTPELRQARRVNRTPLAEKIVERLREEFHLNTDETLAAMTNRPWSKADIPWEQYDSEFYEQQIANSARGLPELLKGYCLDPKSNIAAGVWFFEDLMGALRTVREEFAAGARRRLADTAVSRTMYSILGFCADQRRMVLIEGLAGIGRTATLRAWCDSHAGVVRYVETPSSNDERSFYVRIAEALGVARGFAFNTQQIKLKVEEALKASGLIIALDEAQYLWPQYNRAQGFPSRMLWIKAAYDAGTPFALVALTDFSKWQKLYVKRTLWSDEQFERRVTRKELPAQHPVDDMIRIARTHYPEGNERCWRLLAGCAMTSPKKQASAVLEALDWARYRAKQAGRATPSFADIKAAAMVDVLGGDEGSCNGEAASLQMPCSDAARSRGGAPAASFLSEARSAVEVSADRTARRAC